MSAVLYIVTWKMPAGQRRKWPSRLEYEPVPEHILYRLYSVPVAVGEERSQSWGARRCKCTAIACQRVEVVDAAS